MIKGSKEHLLLYKGKTQANVRVIPGKKSKTLSCVTVTGSDNASKKSSYCTVYISTNVTKPLPQFTNSCISSSRMNSQQNLAVVLKT